MKNMYNFILVTFFFTFTPMVSAQILEHDFRCDGRIKTGEKFKISIININLFQEVSVEIGSKICTNQITFGAFLDRLPSPQMLINFRSKKECPLPKKLKILEEGFIKAEQKKGASTYVLFLYDHQPIACAVKSFKADKLRAKFVALYK